MGAAILLPALLIMFAAGGLLLAEANGSHAVRGDSERNQILLGGIGAAIAEGEVIFGRAAFVTMTLHGYSDLRIITQEFSSFAEGFASIGTNIGLIEVEQSVTHFLQKELVDRWARWRRRRRGRDRDTSGGCGRAAGPAGRGGIRGGVGRRYLRGAFGLNVTDLRRHSDLRGVGRRPCQGRSITLLDRIRGCFEGDRRFGRGWRRRRSRWRCGNWLSFMATDRKNHRRQQGNHRNAVNTSHSPIHSLVLLKTKNPGFHPTTRAIVHLAGKHQGIPRDTI